MSIPTPKEEFLAGARTMAPVLIGTVPFGFVAGVATVAAGMTVDLPHLYRAASRARARQLRRWRSAAVVLGAAAAVLLLIVGMRLEVRVEAHQVTLRWRLLISYVLTDQCFAAAVRYYDQPGDRSHRHWNFMGAAATLYLSWQAAVAVGVVAGAAVPASWSLDFAVVLSFISLLIPAVRTRTDLAVAIVAGAVALMAAGLPYRLSLVAASIAGIAAGMAIELRREARR